MPDQDFEFERRVEFADTDMAGIAHFTSLLRYMEEAEHAFLRSRGLSLFQPLADGMASWPRRSVHADFLSPARMGDVLTIAVIPRQVGRRSVTWEFRISCQGRPVATGQTVSVFCRIRPEPVEAVAIPADVAARLQQCSPTLGNR